MRIPLAITLRLTGIVGVASVGVVLVGVTGCTSTPSSPAARTTTTTAAGPAPSAAATSSSSSPADIAASDAITAYLGMWQAFATAGATSDWQSPVLARYATGIALSNMSRGLYADHYNGVVTKGKPVLHPSAVSVTPPDDPVTVIINDCGDSTNYLKYYASTGKSVNDGPGGRQFIRATVQKQSDGSWKVADFGIQPIGSC